MLILSRHQPLYPERRSAWELNDDIDRAAHAFNVAPKRGKHRVAALSQP
jgi:hypothetical protein